MPSLPAPEVAVLLREFGQRTALRGGNPYRAKAYTRAAENLLALTEPLEDLIAEGRLKEIPGVGDAIADIIAKLHKTGDHPSLQAMRKEIPPAALEMLGIPGLRPDKVLKIYRSKKEIAPPTIPPGTADTNGKTYLKFACTDGYIHVLDLQLEGKKRMTIEDFLRGYRF